MPDEVQFVAERLRMAREMRGLTQQKVASAAGLTAGAVSQFESGAVKPTTDTARDLAEALSVPREFLARPLSSTHDGFFRSLRRTRVSDRRKARAVAVIAHDLAIGSSLPRLDVPMAPVPDLDASSPAVLEAAQTVRRSWQLPPGPIDDVVRLLEDHGVLVVRLPLTTADVDAFSLPFDDRPVVVLGADKNDAARSRFDASHELGHLVMHGQQVWGVKEVESQAHKFAAEFLMPESDIRAQLPTRPDWGVLFELKKHWKVSLAALLLRARDLEVMHPNQYLTGIKYMSARGWRTREPVPLGACERPVASMQALQHQAELAGSVLPADVVDQLLGASQV